MNGLTKALLYFLLATFCHSVSAQDGIFHLDSLASGTRGAATAIKEKWKYHKGDDIKWANPAFDDSQWISAPSNFNLAKLPENSFQGIGWFRIHVIVDTTLVNKTIGLLLAQVGASEIYLDGKLLYKFGTINVKDPTKERRYDPGSLPVDVRFENTRNHVLAVRYANTRAVSDFEENENDSPGFIIKFRNLRDAIEYRYVDSNTMTAVFVFYFTFFIAIGLLHFMLFLYYRQNKSNLYYSIFNFAFGVMFIWLLGQQNLLYPDTVSQLQTMGRYLPNIYAPALLALLYSIFYKKLPKIFWLWLSLYIIDFITSILNVSSDILYIITLLLFVVESLRIIVVSIYKKRDGAWIIGIGVITTLVFFTAYSIISLVSHNINFSFNGWFGLILGIITILTTLSIPFSMTVYLARDFSKTNKDLSAQLQQVQILSQQAIEQEHEKQKILNEQNAMLEHQVTERTAELSEKNKEMTDSIRYAQRIQKALMSSKNLLDKNLPEHFVFFNPKDIVSGDFYWASPMHDGRFALVTADSTGHGVPGAFMSLLNISYLNEAINERQLTDTSDILNHARKKIIQSLAEDGTADGGKDGMDCSIAAFDFKNKTMQYSAANNPVWIIRDNTILEFNADKMPVGKHDRDTVPFTVHTIQLQAGDIVYTLTDGFPDQFGGPKGKKFKYKSLQELLLSVCHLPMDAQKEKLAAAFNSWKGNLEQVDDVLLIGVHI